MKTNLIAFEPFGKIDPSKPYKLIPQGLWYRGSRKLDITAQRLREMVRNFKEKLPNYRLAVNLNHEDNEGKVGNITDVKYQEQGPDGPGLYVDFELSDKGHKSVDEDGYDGISAEIAWSLNGSSYQDPKDGTEHDNVLLGMGLTPHPYFGHDEVALYTADRERAFDVERVEIYRPYGGATTFDGYDEWLNAQKLESDVHMTTYVLRELIENVLNDDAIEDKGSVISTLANEFQSRISQAGSEDMGLIDRVRAALSGGDDFRKFTTEQRKKLTKEGKAMKDGSFPIVTAGDLKNAIQAIGRAKNRAAAMKHIKKRARALGKTDMIPEGWVAESDQKEAMAMAKKEKEKEKEEAPKDEAQKLEKKEEQPVETAATETTVTSTATIETLSEELKISSKRADKLEADLKAERMARRQTDLTADAEAFKVLPIKTEEYVEKMIALEDASPDLYAWLVEKFEAIDKALEEAGVLLEIGSRQEANLTGAPRYMALVTAKLAEKFDGDMSKWADAMEAVSAEHPKMAQEYSASIQ